MSWCICRQCALAVMSLLLIGCAPSKGPFLMVEMCLSNAEGVREFREELKSIASSEKMEFIDNSRNAQRGLETLGNAGNERKDDTSVVDLRVIRGDGTAISAANLGLPGYQMAVGFTEGSGVPPARAIAARTLSRLKMRWTVEPVPNGFGAAPMPGCR
jgi:hypothetical protein